MHIYIYITYIYMHIYIYIITLLQNIYNVCIFNITFINCSLIKQMMNDATLMLLLNTDIR